MNNPLKSPLVLRIGVTGHRPDPVNSPEEKRKRPLPDIPAIHKAIHDILEVIRNTLNGIAHNSGHLFDLKPNQYSQPGGGVLRIVSALASGADQWVAQIATGTDFNLELQCILPFHRDEYVKDFSEPSDIELFKKLLQQASTILELDGKVEEDEDGNREPDSRSYEAVGRAVLNQSDLLIAIWDGEEARGKGGTGQMVQEALLEGIPVIRVPWTSPGNWFIQSPAWQRLEEGPDEDRNTSRLSAVIEKIVLSFSNGL
jgi:hypothetical protein